MAADRLSERLSGGRGARPAPDVKHGVRDLRSAHDSADVFDDQGPDHLGMLRGELVGRDAAKGMPEHHHGAAAEPVDYRSGVSDELCPGEGAAVIGKAMAALVQCHHPNRSAQPVGKGSENSAAAEAAV